MNEDDLNRAWVCHQCGVLFIFVSDKEKHRELSGHNRFAVFDLQSGRMLKAH